MSLLQPVGSTTQVQQETYTTPPGSVAPAVNRSTRVSNQMLVPAASRINQVIWFFFGVLNTLLVLRIVFLLLAARDSGFTQFLYNLTNPFVAPFMGIFPAPAGNGSYFDTAGIVAIIIYSLLAWGITKLVKIMLANQVAPAPVS
jgi:uncharacterized protein YggT (Ycf19 family)